jgi:hypothetical protein
LAVIVVVITAVNRVVIALERMAEYPDLGIGKQKLLDEA